MKQPEFDAEFRKAKKVDPPIYLKVRERLCHRGKEAIPFLQRESSNSDWKSQCTARILLAWIECPDLCNQVTENVLGTWPGHAEDTVGEAPVEFRVRRLEALDPRAVYRLIEMLLWTGEAADALSQGAIFTGFAAYRDPIVLAPLLAVVERDWFGEPAPDVPAHIQEQAHRYGYRGTGTSTERLDALESALSPSPASTLMKAHDDAFRIAAMNTLILLDSEWAARSLGKLISADVESDLLRASAIAALGWGKTPLAFAVLEEKFAAHAQELPQLVPHLVAALGNANPKDAAHLFSNHLDAHQGQVLAEMLRTIARGGDASHFGAVRKLKGCIHDRSLAALVDQTLESIRNKR